MPCLVPAGSEASRNGSTRPSPSLQAGPSMIHPHRGHVPMPGIARRRRRRPLTSLPYAPTNETLPPAAATTSRRQRPVPPILRAHSPGLALLGEEVPVHCPARVRGGRLLGTIDSNDRGWAMRGSGGKNALDRGKRRLNHGQSLAARRAHGSDLR